MGRKSNAQKEAERLKREELNKPVEVKKDEPKVPYWKARCNK